MQNIIPQNDKFFPVSYSLKFALFLFLFLFVLAPYLKVSSFTLNAALIAYFAFIVISYNAIKSAIFSKLGLSIIVFVLSVVAYSLLISIINQSLNLLFLKLVLSVLSYLIFGIALGYMFFKRGLPYELAIHLMLKILLLIIFINSTVIIIEYYFPAIKLSIENFMYQGGNINYMRHSFRMRGLASAGGASLSVLHGLGIVLSLYLYKNKKISLLIFLISSLCILISLLYIGRTGLLVAVTGVFLLMLNNMISKNAKDILRTFLYAFFIVVFILIIPLLLEYFIDPLVANYSILFLFSGLEGLEKEGTISIVANMYNFPQEWHQVLFGVGDFSGNFNVGESADIGYMKMLTALGFPIAFLIYLSIVLFAYSHFRHRTGGDVMLLFLFLLFFVETKEPFILQGYSARILFLILGMTAAYNYLIKKQTEKYPISGDMLETR